MRDLLEMAGATLLAAIFYLAPWAIIFFGLTLAQNLRDGCGWSFNLSGWTGLCA